MSKNSTKRATAKTAPNKTQGAAGARKSRRASKDAVVPPIDEIRSPSPSTLRPGAFAGELRPPRRERGAGAAGQSGDLQGLPNEPNADSESVQELAAEGQALEAQLVSAMGEAKDADQGELRTHEIPVDDIPEEYVDAEHTQPGKTTKR